jgi:hypothetical protein
MNEQNINNILEYIKQNSSFPLDTLRDVCLKAGYAPEEFNQAVIRLQTPQNSQGLPLVPTYSSVELGSEPSPEPSPKESSPLIPQTSPQTYTPATTFQTVEGKDKKGFPVKLLIGVVLGILLIGLVIVGFLMFSKIGQVEEVPSPTPEEVILPTVAPSPTPLVVNPLSTFSATLVASDYKITTLGRIENKVTLKDPTTGKTQVIDSVIDLTNGIVYTKKGAVVRLDKVDPKKPEVTLLKGDRLFYLNPLTKTYTPYLFTDDVGKYLISTLMNSYPLISLIADSQNNLLSWVKGTNDNEWQTDWQVKSLADQKGTLAKVKIIIDPATNLVTTMSFKYSTDKTWQDAKFAYEVAPNLDSLLVVPTGYKEATSQAILKK